MDRRNKTIILFFVLIGVSEMCSAFTIKNHKGSVVCSVDNGTFRDVNGTVIGKAVRHRVQGANGALLGTLDTSDTLRDVSGTKRCKFLQFVHGLGVVFLYRGKEFNVFNQRVYDNNGRVKFLLSGYHRLQDIKYLAIYITFFGSI